jgi:hypothetical protein
MEDRPVMTDEQMIKDYPRLKLEYTRLHEDFRRLQSKQLIIGDVSILLFDFWHYTKNGNNQDTPTEEIKEGVEMFLSNYKR